jgi:hypothetical protein
LPFHFMCSLPDFLLGRSSDQKAGDEPLSIDPVNLVLSLLTHIIAMQSPARKTVTYCLLTRTRACKARTKILQVTVRIFANCQAC